LRRRSPDAAGGFTSVAVIFLIGLIGGVLANVYFPFLIWPGTVIRAIGFLPLLLGVALFAWARATFRRHMTALMPWTRTTALVTDGPYGFSRNPIYLSFVLMYLGLSFISDSAYVLIMLVVVIVLFDRLQIPREERYLRGLFGAEFDSYAAKVRRWL
jgi:protein-S-isoprenylcysteine O-methyltransferase Ste14